MNKELLELRRKIKKKKPDFIRQCANKKKRLGKKYRRAKGIDSKMRLKLKGHLRNISKGYKSPKAVRGLSREGLIQVRISSLNDLKNIDKEKQGIIIASSVGLKKKIEIIKKAKKQGIKILNIKDPDAYLKKIEEMLKEKREKKEKEKEEMKKKEEEMKKKSKNLEEKLEKKLDEEEKKERERKEKEKILIKKQ